jgi:hypothetical protein
VRSGGHKTLVGAAQYLHLVHPLRTNRVSTLNPTSFEPASCPCRAKAKRALPVPVSVRFVSACIGPKSLFKKVDELTGTYPRAAGPRPQRDGPIWVYNSGRLGLTWS